MLKLKEQFLNSFAGSIIFNSCIASYTFIMLSFAISMHYFCLFILLLKYCINTSQLITEFLSIYEVYVDRNYSVLSPRCQWFTVVSGHSLPTIQGNTGECCINGALGQVSNIPLKYSSSLTTVPIQNLYIHLNVILCFSMEFQRSCLICFD